MQIRTARILLGSGLVAITLGISGLSINYYQQRKEQYKEVMLKIYDELEEDQETDIDLLYHKLLRSQYSKTVKSLGYENFAEIFKNAQRLADKVNKGEGIRFIDTNSDSVRKFRSAVKNLNDKL